MRRFSSLWWVPLSVGLFALAVGAADAKKPIVSGVQVGGSVGAFQTKDLTGPSKGKTLCYV